ncbi:glycosyl hydrolase family 65 central catalytic domain protein [Enterococcus canis]|uniref:Glycosyl hydrolase family 65 central catalytic domain protein n=1 Tax=Enterococcus canis TaxID=214095 RepID=A0A1L8RKN0_9ENTE|nr:glycosyl hydrolase family 65 protein [Enterococcus canis]OJG20331.1 glycosyl hydrolase family 65 central catalytic domain protein [Enterococcus canis]
MKHATIQVIEQALHFTGPDQKAISFDDTNIKVIQQLCDEQQLIGGTIESSPINVTTTNGQQDLAHWLSEQLNLPFAYQAEDLAQAQADFPWILRYSGYTPGKDEYSVESLLTIGNGFLGLRGTTPEMEIADENYPATYLASLYDQAASKVGDRTIYNEDFVNAPNLQKIYLLIDNEKIDIANNHILSFERELDLRTGLFQSKALIETRQGKQVLITSKKIVSMAAKHYYSISYQVTPVNFSGTLTLVAEADGAVYNYNVARYRSLTQRHLTIDKLAANGANALLVAKTKQSQITISQHSTLHSELDLTNLVIEQTDEKIQQKLTFSASEGTAYTLEKTVAVYQARPHEKLPDVGLSLASLPNFNALYSESKKAWRKLWREAGLKVEGDLMSQKLLNLHTYHLLCSASPNGNQGLDASVTARGLHGEAYRGHIFWDELFILPFYILHFPETAKQLLLYRYHRLAAAKKAASEVGYEGAMFPWQSGLDGSEESQELHLNPISGEWKEDHSRRQRHVSLAIAYNVWQYWHNTRDREFMIDYGLEIMLEIAAFWRSIAQWDPQTERYIIEGVMGPDEFHEGYPHSKTGGLKNNAYTNMMVVWLFEEVEKLQHYFPQELPLITNQIGLTSEKLAEIGKIRQRLQLEIDPAGIIAQFEGYFQLQELDWDYYREKYGNVYRMDRILNAEGRSADEYQVAKQADSLMIFYNLAKNQVDRILHDLGYKLPDNYVEKNLHYYLARTSHGSTLSRVVHAQLAAMVKEDALAWQLYQEALTSDYQDIQGGTTAEGIHAGVMAATLFIPLTTFAGMDIREQQLHFQPRMPQAWQSLSYRMTFQGIRYKVSVSHDALVISPSHPTTILVNQTAYSLNAGEATTIFYKEVL